MPMPTNQSVPMPQSPQQQLKECHAPWIPNSQAQCDKCWTVRRSTARAVLVPTKQPDSFIRVCLTRSKVWQNPSPLMKSSPLQSSMLRAIRQGSNKYHPVKISSQLVFNSAEWGIQTLFKVKLVLSEQLPNWCLVCHLNITLHLTQQGKISFKETVQELFL